MDTVSFRERFTDLIKKYKYAFIIVLAGVILMCLPTGREDRPQTEEPVTHMPAVQPTLSDSLEQILSQIQGAGRVKVLLAEASGSETLYQMDEDVDTGADNSSIRNDVVLITGEDRAQSGLVRQVNPPQYLGAVVVCQGADNAVVRLSVVEAVSNVTGLGADHITVLKMK